MDYRYKSSFTAFARVAICSDRDRFEAKASLLPLRGILPAGVNPADDPDLLYLSCNGAVAGLCNKNFDAINNSTALAIYRSARNKFISKEHDRDQIVGVVLYPALTKFGSNEPITEEQASQLQEPFNMAFAGIIWRVVDPMVVNFLSKSEMGEEGLSMSWEIAFNSFNIGVGSKNLFDARVIDEKDPSFASYEKMLKINGGTGKDHAGQDVYRIIGNDSIILGYSVVVNPAAEVKGILPIGPSKPVSTEPAPASVLDQIPESQRSFLEENIESGAGYHLCDITMIDGTVHKNVAVLNRRFLPLGIEGNQISSISISQKSEEKNITPSQARVNLNTDQIMKIESLQQLESEWATISKQQTAAAVSDFVKAIEEGSKQFEKDLQAKEDFIKNAEASRIENENKVKELQASIDSLKGELKQVKLQAQANEAQQKFTERMAAFDEEFDLDSEDRQMIGSDIKDLSDEAFAAHMAKCKKLMAGKAKKKVSKSDDMGEPDAMAKSKAKEDKDSGDDGSDKGKQKSGNDEKKGGKNADDGGHGDDSDEDDEDKKGKKTKDSSASDKAIKEAFASVKEIDGQGAALRSDGPVDQTALNEMAEAFGATLKINGKTVKERAAKKAAKQQTS